MEEKVVRVPRIAVGYPVTLTISEGFLGKYDPDLKPLVLLLGFNVVLSNHDIACLFGPWSPLPACYVS